MKIEFADHAETRMHERGATEREVIETVRNGIPVKAKKGRWAKEQVFIFSKDWEGKFYPEKKIKVVFVKEGGTIVVITVYVYYGHWGGKDEDHL